MKEKIVGQRYDFLIELEKYGRSNCFHILSRYKKGKRKSTITNLNFIISELINPTLKIDEENIDTELILNHQQAEKLFFETVSTFKNKSWLDNLEVHLDEDRKLGGWNSDFRF